MSKGLRSTLLGWRLPNTDTGTPQRSRHRGDGDAARDERDWPRAAAAYRRHLEESPEDFDIWVQLGHATKEAGAFAEAEDAYEEARRLRPGDADLLLNIGHLYRRRGNLAEAAFAYRASLAENGNDAARHELSTNDLLPFIGEAEARLSSHLSSQLSI